MSSAVFILDLKGKVIISRNYRGDVPMAGVSDKFTAAVVNQEDSQVKPVFWDVESGVGYAWIKYGTVYLLAVTRRDSNVAMMISYLYKLGDVLKDYFKVVSEEFIKDNFVLTYELLDELCDNGQPQNTEVKVLRQYIKTEASKVISAVKETTRSVFSFSDKAPTLGPSAAVTNVVSWRPEGIKHKKNEVFLDVVERLNLLVSSTGAVLRSEILGSLRLKSYLSGMPELKLGLNDKLLLEGQGQTGKGVEMEDVKFHQCVRLSKFETDRTISFIPPDGEFELMSYRLNTQVKPLIWIEAVLDQPSTAK
jgi:AP-1 complex subunit mu